jgi:VWFA-related protein
MSAQGRVSRCLTARIISILSLPSLVGLWAGAAQNPAPSEVTSNDSEPAFKLEVQRNLVLVRVVVRDSKGNPVGGLHKEDFRLLDNGKPQTISSFTIETPAARPATATNPQPQAAPTGDEPAPDVKANSPLRYLALYFDDVHDSYEDLIRTRDAADHYLASAAGPGDRVGVFTASGQHIQDFTDDLAKIHQGLSRLQPRPVYPTETDPCPDIFPYQAYLIVERRDSPSLQSATEETLLCRYNGDRRLYGDAQQYAESEAVRVLTRDDSQSQYSLRELEQLVRRMAMLPGVRDVVFVSPGFFTETQKYAISEIADRALRSKVIINTFDSKGLFAPVPLGDATRRPIVTPDRPDLVGEKTLNKIASYQFDVEILADLAQDTGGVYFHNSNDLELGFRKVGALADAYYVLAFSPQNLKLDGRFHQLKVSLNVPERYTLQARRGYFAPRKSEDAASQEKDDLAEAVFSQDEMRGLPVEVHTQFFKVNGRETKLSIFAHLDVHLLRFRKEQGRNLNSLTFVTALFDRDGKYVTGQEKRIEFRLLDSSLERLSKSGITNKAIFEVPPGTYMVREVVRDTEQGQMSGLNRTVEIPY